MDFTITVEESILSRSFQITMLLVWFYYTNRNTFKCENCLLALTTGMIKRRIISTAKVEMIQLPAGSLQTV